jgi:hypothetical protein
MDQSQQPDIKGQPVPMVQSYSSFMPGAFISNNSDYLASLDSDTRDYVLKHTDASRTRQDILDCIDKLLNG